MRIPLTDADIGICGKGYDTDYNGSLKMERDPGDANVRKKKR